MSAHELLRTDRLVKRFAGLVATDHACLSVQAGEIHALIGPNGAGKTTLIHQLSGATKPTSGNIWFDGRDITSLSMSRRVGLGLTRSYQVTCVFKRLSVLDNLALAVQSRNGSSMRFWRPVRREYELYVAAAQLAERVGLEDRLHRIVGAMSHGEQRQLEVGLALALRPRLMLLDEPMAGMGPEGSERLLDLLLGLRGAVTMLLVEHDMDAVFRLADRISVLVAGRVIATGTADEIRSSAEVQQAYLGDEAGAAA